MNSCKKGVLLQSEETKLLDSIERNVHENKSGIQFLSRVNLIIVSVLEEITSFSLYKQSKSVGKIPAL